MWKLHNLEAEKKEACLKEFERQWTEDCESERSNTNVIACL